MSRSVAREVAMKLVYSRLLGGDDTPDAVLENRRSRNRSILRMRRFRSSLQTVWKQRSAKWTP